MPNNIGTLVTAPIRVQADGDPISSAYAPEIQGGWHQVANIAARDAIIPERKLDGMACYVIDVSGAYIWNSSSGWTEFASSSTPIDTSSFATVTQVASISGDLQQQIDAIVIPDTSSFATVTQVASISGDLQSQIDAIVIPDTSSFATVTQVASISGDLQQQIDAIVIPDTSSFATVTQVANISGDLQSQIDAIVIPDTSSFATVTQVANISGDLQQQIDSLSLSDLNDVNISGVVNGQTIKYLNGVWVASPDISGAEFTWGSIIGNINDQGDLISILNTKANVTEVASISGDLQQQIDAIVIPDTSSFATVTQVANISGDLQSQIDAIVIPDTSSFATVTQVANISGDLQSQIDGKQNNITLIGGSNISIVESPTDTWTISSNISGGSGSGISVIYDSTTISDVNTINFTGSGVTSLTDNGGGEVTINIESVSGGSGSSTPTVITGSGTTFSPDGQDDVYDYTLTGPATINAPTLMVNGSSIIIKLKQPVAGNASLTLSDGGGFTWKKPNGTITLSTDTGNAEDILTVLRIGNNLYTSIVKNF